jgi:hypothetical protein
MKGTKTKSYGSNANVKESRAKTFPGKKLSGKGKKKSKDGY